MSKVIETRTSVVNPATTATSRKLSKVPYVELAGGRLQGVVASKSSASRVYVSFIEAGTTNFYCSTNNNRPCGGLRGGTCKHLQGLIGEAVTQFGAERVARYLQLAGDPTKMKSARDIQRHLSGSKHKVEASEVFSRYLSYLRLVDMEGTAEPIPEMSWFVQA